MNTRLEIASRIAAGFAANPAIFAPNARCGWRLVNASEAALAKYALELADTLIAASDGARFYWSQGGAVTKDGPITHAIPALDHDPDATAWVAICGAVCSGPPALLCIRLVRPHWTEVAHAYEEAAEHLEMVAAESPDEQERAAFKLVAARIRSAGNRVRPNNRTDAPTGRVE